MSPWHFRLLLVQERENNEGLDEDTGRMGGWPEGQELCIYDSYKSALCDANALPCNMAADVSVVIVFYSRSCLSPYWCHTFISLVGRRYQKLLLPGTYSRQDQTREVLQYPVML